MEGGGWSPALARPRLSRSTRAGTCPRRRSGHGPGRVPVLRRPQQGSAFLPAAANHRTVAELRHGLGIVGIERDRLPLDALGLVEVAGGQAFVRSCAERVYGMTPVQVVGSSLETGYNYDAKGQGELIREPKLEPDNNNSGKAEDIWLFTGQRPQAAFGNSTGDREMLEWTTAGKGKRLGMLVLHDDKEREYAYGPAAGLPDTKVGTFTSKLLDEAEQRGWVVISMKNDWKQIFAFEP